MLRLRRKPKFLHIADWSWLTKAANLPGKAFQVAVLLQRQMVVTGCLSVTLPGHELNDFGVSRFAFYRALDQLASGGLIQTEADTGKSTKVKILPSSVKEH